MADNIDDQRNSAQRTFEIFSDATEKREVGARFLKKSVPFFLAGIILTISPRLMQTLGEATTSSIIYKFIFISSWIGVVVLIGSSVLAIIGIRKYLAARKKLHLLYKKLKKEEAIESP
jgi:hypothetical protein